MINILTYFLFLLLITKYILNAPSRLQTLFPKRPLNIQL
jgi:hypothetical protein